MSKKKPANKPAAKRPKKPVKPKLESLFLPSELGPLSDDFSGKLIVIWPNSMKIEFCTRKFLVWRATGGFGCQAGKIGNAVFAECPADGDTNRFNRGDVAYEYIGDPANL